LNDFFGISWGWVSAFLIFVSGYPYMRAIYTREIERPAVSSWLLWLGIGILLFVTSYQSGSQWGTTLFPILMGVINPAIIVALSLKYGEYTWTRFDTACVIVCAITVMVWQTTRSPVLGLFGGILADAIAAVPQFRKSWKEPKDEPVFPWTMFAFASAINILAVDTWVVDKWLYPVYMTTGSSLLVLPLALNRLKIYK
jgi:hypothetical protein